MEKLIFTKKEFKEVMEVLKATAKEDIRPILQGVNFNNNEVVALDGYRLMLRKIDLQLKGNYTIGVYETETEAAIAYNKAIDYFKKAGVDKAYTPNYMEGISPLAYADLYSSIKISPKIEHYRSE